MAINAEKRLKAVLAFRKEQAAAATPEEAAKHIQTTFRAQGIKCAASVKKYSEGKTIRVEGTQFEQKWNIQFYLEENGKVQLDAYSLGTVEMALWAVDKIPSADRAFPEKLNLGGLQRAFDRYSNGVRASKDRLDELETWLDGFTTALAELSVDVKENR